MTASHDDHGQNQDSPDGRAPDSASAAALKTRAAAVPSFEIAQAARTLREQRVALVEAREDERRRIARNLHDDLGQLLLVLKLEATALRGQCDNPQAAASIEAIELRLAETIDAVRRIVDDLHPTALEDLGLNAALDALVRRTTERLGIEATLLCDEDDPPVSTRLATALYRCAQEALTNAIRHGQATDIAIELFCDDGLVRLTVQDNGLGLPRSDAAPAAQAAVVASAVASATSSAGGGHGLRGLRERLEAFDGVLVLEDAPGSGARLRVQVPLDAP